ncbi:MAG: site-specific integrase, partial [Patescibacteria group bacterium]
MYTAQFKEFLLSQASPASLSTVKNYASDVNRFIAWFENKFQKTFEPSEVNSSTLNIFKTDYLTKYSASSVDRNLSTLRKFFTFLKLDGQISHSPFELEVSSQESEVDPWRIKDFKNHLYVFNASHLTIKNYIIDVKQFLSWVETVLEDKNSWEAGDNELASKIDSNLLEEYKKRLLKEVGLSPVSVNRKLSSLRRYISWATDEGLLRPQPEISNIKYPNFAQASLGKQISNKQLAADSSLEIGNLKLDIPNTKYSGFAPLRLLQKAKAGIISFADALFILPLVSLLEKIQYQAWALKGRPVFAKHRFPQIQKRIPTDPQKSANNLRKSIRNLPKAFYAPWQISTKYFPIHKKVWHHLRNTRPEWYKTYRSYSITNYFHLAILLLFVSVLGYVIYSYVNPNKNQPKTFAALPTAPPRVLSFQGRLTDNSDNPITSSTPLRMAIYNNLTASGAALLWQEIVTVSPDNDGIFSIILGNNTVIPLTVFAENSA